MRMERCRPSGTILDAWLDQRLSVFTAASAPLTSTSWKQKYAQQGTHDFARRSHVRGR